MIRNQVSVNAVQVSEDAGVSDQYSGESDKALQSTPLECVDPSGLTDLHSL